MNELAGINIRLQKSVEFSIQLYSNLFDEPSLKKKATRCINAIQMVIPCFIGFTGNNVTSKSLPFLEFLSFNCIKRVLADCNSEKYVH
jgi:hypothetical protein